MGSPDKSSTFISSFSYALSGILMALKTERNMRFHFISSILVVGMSSYFSITKVEWIFILFIIGGMFALELMNSAIERVVDLVSLDYHPLAKQAKDLAAGAVLLYAALAIVVGIIIFSPYVIRLFSEI
ncbi:diacylglycerol kinase family protein [Neobacillus sp. MM2021_6]|uniref:diacylglycerol kinase family protein n=1 Tax=Bacillaceae TaxID=186817 RepID=UPI0014082BF5|nr:MULTISPECIES: diacylglycerol kinase family protein [Bacillaceae]MBO0959460.1 diacylglycerol kinase family protein [Neobacillus sp. MM2021_6]NHC17242.1 diacylglycerol kinase family protein [Bacillus sp. MM2020_4]